MAFPKFQTKEVLNKVLNTGEDALNVDIADSITVAVDLDHDDDSVQIYGTDGTLRAIATDSSGNLQVDVLSITAGDNNIGNVDIVTVPAPLSTTGSGTEAAALRVTIATNSTGVLSIDDNGGSLTVDGTVTANLSSTDNAVLDAMAASLALLDNSIASGS